jgi:DNA polymerase III alpha subunit
MSRSVWRRAGTPPRLLALLAEADAFASLGLSRREALWQARALASDGPLPLFAGDMDGEGITEPAARLPEMTEGEEVVEDYVSMRLTLRKHPMAFLRAKLSEGLPAPRPPRPDGFARTSGLTRADAWESREGPGRPHSATTRH